MVAVGSVPAGVAGAKYPAAARTAGVPPMPNNLLIYITPLIFTAH